VVAVYQRVSAVLTPIATQSLSRFGRRGAVAEEFAALIRELWRADAAAPVAARGLKKQLGHCNRLFAGYGQQDSQELLRFLLDGLHQDT
jgi:ubiquitin carboxyl-terminal hydrolase 4/11/15